jgi:plastocyanin
VRFKPLAILASAVVLSACSTATKATTNKNSTDVVNTPRPSNPHEVVIYNYKFDPPTLTVPIETTVTWVNQDIAPHTATHRSFGDEPFDSGALGYKATFSHTFRTAGTYAYLCVLHQGMMGTIVVQ